MEHPPIKDKQSKKDDYSGKKAYRKKNLLISSHRRRVVYLGLTSPNGVHDKKSVGERGLRLPADVPILKDRVFQGYEPPKTKALQPTRRPRSRELYSRQKAINLVVKMRVGIEHVICGVKRCRIVADTFRNLRSGFVDRAMELFSALHDLSVAARA